MASKKSHRGRFQAQGGGIEESVKWALNKPCTKSHANKAIRELKNKLSSSELSVREKCFERVMNFVQRSPSNGLMAIIKKPFTPIPPKRDIRVDIEILAGKAFIDD